MDNYSNMTKEELIEELKKRDAQVADLKEQYNTLVRGGCC